MKTGRSTARLPGSLAVDAQDDVIARDVGPGGLECVHVITRVHVRPVQDHHDRPFLAVVFLVPCRAQHRIRQQVLGRTEDDRAGGERHVADELGSLAAVPAVPGGHAVGPPRAGEAGGLLVEIEPARPVPERLDFELQVPARHLAFEARGATERISSLHLRTLLRQLHEAEIRQPEPGEIRRIALRRGRVRSPPVQDAPAPVARLERPPEGIPRRLQLQRRIDVNVSLVVADGQLLALKLALQRELECDDLARHIRPFLLEAHRTERGFPLARESAGILPALSGAANATRENATRANGDSFMGALSSSWQLGVCISVSREWTGNHRSPLTSMSLTQAMYPAESNFFRVLS